MNNDYNYGVRENERGLTSYVSRVFGWMFVGLLITAFFAFSVVGTSWGKVILNPAVMLFLVVAELGLVFGLSLLINKVSSITATMLFLLYSAVNGLTLSTIFYAYNIGVIGKAFIVAAAVFGVMAVYGYVTKTDLTRVGSLFFMGVIGILIASVINIFFKSSMLDMIISYVTVFIFLGLVAYDTQKIKAYYEMGTGYGNQEMLSKGAIVSALGLYLDFINIFLALLRIFNSRD